MFLFFFFLIDFFNKNSSDGMLKLFTVAQVDLKA